MWTDLVAWHLWSNFCLQNVQAAWLAHVLPPGTRKIIHVLFLEVVWYLAELLLHTSKLIQIPHGFTV